MITIWHNPRCSKSRETLALIRDKAGETPVTERRYLDDSPSVAEIETALGLLDLQPADLMRVREKRFKELGLSETDPAESLIAAMADNPVLIERPIVFANGKAAIGRPPENVLAIL